jgi:beta-lactamase superfamily II metal-dependent hydrolase
MKLIIFDVGNAACSIVSSPNKYGLMIDCGSNSEKTNPVDIYNNNKEWLETTPFITSMGTEYEIGLLHITHPDDDHVRNAKRIREELTPYLLIKRKYEEFPDSDSINQDYIDYIDKVYRGSNPETIDWGFDVNDFFQIPMETLKSNELLSKKIRNNSSILRYIEYNGTRILFTGDMETEGWDWIIENNKSFVDTIKNGVDIIIAPHHGHESGFPKALFDITGEVKLVIHSKGSEGNIEGTDVSSQYSENAEGINYKNLNDKAFYRGKVLTTRSNGDIYITVNDNSFTVWASKASPNHEKVT